MKRYALIVGISQYGSNMLGDLQKPASDAEAIAQILEKHGDFQEVKRLPANWLNHYQCEVADSQLTGEELTRELKYFLLEQAKNSEALIYFSGHGFAIWDDLGEEYEGFLATSNCEINREREKLIAQQNGISLRRLNGLISKAQVSSLVVILDCCHAGSLLEDDLVKQALITFNTSEKDYYLIAACRSGEKAYEGKQYSIFTEALLKGLAEENAGNDGKISCDRVFDLIDSELQGLGQEPIRMGSGRSITLVTHTNKIRNQHCEVKEECPYQSLKAFEAEQKQFFFGRKQVVNDILARLTQKPFVPVIGASGSGKSSVIRAGVIPELEDRGWRVLDPIKPGFEPLIELRRTFRKFFLGTTKEKQLKDLIENQENTLAVIIEHLPASEQFLLVVDQFEEVFTICADREERQRFIQLLTQVINVADSPLAVAITLRADFLEPCLDYPSLTKLIQTQAVFIPSLTGIDLQDAIKEPAKLQGYSVQDKLFMKILEDVNKEPGFLPLLEFTLTELWQKRDREKHQLTLEQYEKLGELNGTLNSHAEKVYNYKDFEEDNPIQERTQQEKDWIKLIFLRLIRTGKNKKDTRQRQPKTKLLAIHLQVSASPITGDEIEKQEILSELLDGENGLVKGRLLVSGKDQEEKAWIDLAHEALIEGWQRFSQWRQENWALRKLIDRVEDLFWEWQKEPDNENLMMGGLLRQVRRKWLEIEPLLEPKIKKYYQLSYDYKNNYEKHLKSTMYPHMTQELAEDLLQLDDDKLGGDDKEVSILFS
nr:caspase family protein [Mastigocoleus sp. MO_167.B18]